MAQGLLPYHYEVDQRSSGATAWGGLPIALDLAAVSGLIAALDEHMKIRAHGRGWPDRVVVMTLVLLNLVGGESVEDVRSLAGDEGLRRLLRQTMLHGLPRAERRRIERQMRRSGEAVTPSPDAVLRYLESFHDEEEEARRVPGTAFIPKSTDELRSLYAVNAELLRFAQAREPAKHATLDMDATLVESHKRQALFCYKGFRAYQPLQVYWAERELMVHSEFRDGNVNAGYQQLRVLEEALAMLPPGLETVSLRCDSAGYEVELLKYCAEGRNERFGTIDFAISADVTQAFRTAVAELTEEDWRPLRRDLGGGGGNECFMDTGQEYAEVVYVPNWAGHSKKGPDYRFLAIREPMQNELPGLEPEVQPELPFQTMTADSGQRYKLFAVVTNRSQDEIAGDELIWWHRKRCGKSEAAHTIMKHDLAGGRLPSEHFGANAAWWAIMILSFNLLAILRQAVLPKELKSARLKRLRFVLFAVAGTVVSRARRTVVRIAAANPAMALLSAARARIAELAQPPLAPAPT
jgi:hypothetical protein